MLTSGDAAAGPPLSGHPPRTSPDATIPDGLAISAGRGALAAQASVDEGRPGSGWAEPCLARCCTGGARDGGDEGGGGSPGEERCRVCLEGVAGGDLEGSGALRLGCSCSSGLDVLHVECAERWFRTRRCSSACACCRCEVCGSEAAGLPESLKKELLENSIRAAGRSDSAAETPSSPEQFRWTTGPTGPTGPAARSRSCCSFYCTIPAATALLSLAVFYTVFLDMKVLPSFLVASIVASTTMLHWVTVPLRPAAHVAVVLWFLLSVLWITDILVTMKNWNPPRASLFGVLAGVLFAGATYGLAESAWASLAVTYPWAQGQARRFLGAQGQARRFLGAQGQARRFLGARGQARQFLGARGQARRFLGARYPTWRSVWAWVGRERNDSDGAATSMGTDDWSMGEYESAV